MTDDTEPDVPPAAPRGAWRSSPTTVRFLAPAVVVAVALGAVALGVTLTSPDATASTHPPASCSASTAKLTVQGTGQATVSPDLLSVVVDVDASGPSATAAMASDNVNVTGAVAAFVGGGVAAKDIQTSGLSLQPQYAYPKGVPIVTGFGVTNTVTATLRDVTKAGAVIDAVVGAAGNAVHIDSISFSVAHPSGTEDVARSRAVTQAVSHASRAAAPPPGPSALSAPSPTRPNPRLFRPSTKGILPGPRRGPPPPSPRCRSKLERRPIRPRSLWSTPSSLCPRVDRAPGERVGKIARSRVTPHQL